MTILTLRVDLVSLPKWNTSAFCLGRPLSNYLMTDEFAMLNVLGKLDVVFSFRSFIQWWNFADENWIEV